MSPLGTILVVVLVIILLGGFASWPNGPGYGFGHGGNGVVGFALLIVLVLWLTGKI